MRAGLAHTLLLPCLSPSCSTLDYVWLSSGHWAVSAALQMPYRFDAPPPPGQAARVLDPEEVTDLPPLPNEFFASDHLALGFRVHLLPPDR